MISISCQFETTAGSKPECIHCGYVWHGEGPPPVRDCPASPGYQEIAALVGYRGEMTSDVVAMFQRWCLLGQPLRSDEQVAAATAACPSCEVAGCLRLHRMATWQCPKIVAPPSPSLVLPGQGKTEEQLKRDVVEVMRESAKAVEGADADTIDARLTECADCPVLRWDGCGLPCTCSDLWRKWRERICSGNCDRFDHSIAPATRELGPIGPDSQS